MKDTGRNTIDGTWAQGGAPNILTGVRMEIVLRGIRPGWRAVDTIKLGVQEGAP